MDFFTVGRGVNPFWPFSLERFASPVPVFYGLHWSYGWRGFFFLRKSLISARIPLRSSLKLMPPQTTSELNGVILSN